MLSTYSGFIDNNILHIYFPFLQYLDENLWL